MLKLHRRMNGGGRDEAGMTLGAKVGNRSPLGGLWGWVGHNPKVGQDLREHSGLLNESDE